MDTNTQDKVPLWKQAAGAIAGMLIALGIYQAWGSAQPMVKGYLLTSPIFGSGAYSGQMRFSDKDAAFSEYRKAAGLTTRVSRILTGSDESKAVTIVGAASSSSSSIATAAIAAASQASSTSEAFVPAFAFDFTAVVEAPAEVASSAPSSRGIAAIGRVPRASATVAAVTDGKGDDGKGKGPGLPSSGPAEWSLALVALLGAAVAVPAWRKRFVEVFSR